MTRKWLLTLVFLALGAVPASAQTWAVKFFDKEGRAEKLTHDFGTVARGTQLKHSFKMTNIYAVRMEVTSIKSGCGCVTATAAKRVLEPHESTTIDISMDGRRFSGKKTVTVSVTVGPEHISTAELKVSATSRTDVVLNPGEVNFGTVTRGLTPTQTIDVEYAGALRWEVSEVLAKDVPYTVTSKELYRRPGQVGYRLTVTMKENAAIGALKHTVYLKTNDTASPLVPMLIEASVQSPLSVSPAALNLGAVVVGAPLTRRVLVRGNKAFTVTGIEGMSDGIELGMPLNTTAAEVQFVTFKCTFDKAGAFRREVKIKTSLQDAPISLVIDGNAVAR